MDAKNLNEPIGYKSIFMYYFFLIPHGILFIATMILKMLTIIKISNQKKLEQLFQLFLICPIQLCTYFTNIKY
jgi:hypothetical protein